MDKILEGIMLYGGGVVVVLSGLLLGSFIWDVIIPFFF